MVERRAASRLPHALKVGDILYSSWGYDQTNIDFYQVIELRGKTQVILRELAQDRIKTGWLQGDATPKLGEFTSDPIRRKADHQNNVRICSVCHARPWDGKPKWYSQYA